MEATAAASSGGSFYTTDGGEVDRNNSSSSSSSSSSSWSWSWSWSSQQQLWQQWQSRVWSKSQQWLDRCTPYPLWRWLATLAVACVYCIRVLVFLQGFYIVTYGLGIYLLNLLIGFLSPQLDPDTQAPSLPTKATDEFKPFLRRLPEFKFWYSLTKAICIAFVMTFFSVFDVPVFWPILLLYWILLFVLTMKRQLRHMIKYKYVPFDFGKQRYAGKAATSEKDFKKLQEDITTSGIKDNTDAEASG